MITKVAAYAALYVTALCFSLSAIRCGNAQCIQSGIATSISHDLVREGQNVTLSCYVSGANGQPISWANPAGDLLSVGISVSPDIGSRFTVNGDNADPSCVVYNLTITNLTSSDAGTYACRPTSNTEPISTQVISFAYIPGPTYPECKVTGSSTLVTVGETLEFVCETEPGNPEWDLIWQSSQYRLTATPTTSSVTNSELKSITATINATSDQHGKIMTCRATCGDPSCADTQVRNCSLGPIIVVDHPVDTYFTVTDEMMYVTEGNNASIGCETTLPGAEVRWFLHETVTENFVTVNTPTGEEAILHLTSITSQTIENPFICSLHVDGNIVATKSVSLLFGQTTTTAALTTTAIATATMATSAFNSTDFVPVNVSANPLVNATAYPPLNTTNLPGNTTTASSTNLTTTLVVANTTTPGVTTAVATTNATVAVTTTAATPTTLAPRLQTNITEAATQPPQVTTDSQANGTTESNNATTSQNTTSSTTEQYNPTIKQGNMTTMQWWQPRTTFFPQQTMFPQEPTNFLPQQPSTNTPTEPKATREGPDTGLAAFFTLPVIMGVASVGGLILIFIITAIVCVLTSKKRRGGAHDVEELTELSKRNSKPIRLDPFEVPANTTTESDPTFAAFGKGTSTQDLININDDTPSNKQQNGSNNTGKNNKKNGDSESRPLTANDLLGNGNHGVSDSIL